MKIDSTPVEFKNSELENYLRVLVVGNVSSCKSSLVNCIAGHYISSVAMAAETSYGTTYVLSTKKGTEGNGIYVSRQIVTMKGNNEKIKNLLQKNSKTQNCNEFINRILEDFIVSKAKKKKYVTVEKDGKVVSVKPIDNDKTKDNEEQISIDSKYFSKFTDDEKIL